jgi:hypothetical protein
MTNETKTQVAGPLADEPQVPRAGIVQMINSRNETFYRGTRVLYASEPGAVESLECSHQPRCIGFIEIKMESGATVHVHIDDVKPAE